MRRPRFGFWDYVLVVLWAVAGASGAMFGSLNAIRSSVADFLSGAYHCDNCNTAGSAAANATCVSEPHHTRFGKDCSQARCQFVTTYLYFPPHTHIPGCA